MISGGFSAPTGFNVLNRGGSRGVPSFGGLNAKSPADGGGGWQDYKMPNEDNPMSDQLGPRDAWGGGLKGNAPQSKGVFWGQPLMQALQQRGSQSAGASPASGPAPAPVAAAPPTPSTPLDVWNNWLQSMGPYLAQRPTSTPDFSGWAPPPGSAGPSGAATPFEGRRPRRFGPSDEFEEGFGGLRTL